MMAIRRGGTTPVNSSDLSLGWSRFSVMRTMRMWVGLIALSCSAIFLLNSIGDLVPGETYDSIASFSTVGVVFFLLMRFLRLPTLQYFAKPVLGWRFLVALVLSINLIVVQLQGEPFHNLSIGQWVRGVIFLFAVGAAEEILSRGVVFGILLRHGLPIAAIASSLMFGLMHINVYIGHWDPWQAYWHVMSAASFGFFACALMVVTKSLWMPILLHFFSNGALIFETPPTKEELDLRVSIDFWQGVLHPLSPFLTFLIPALILFWIHAGNPVPGWFVRLAIKFGLVEKEVEPAPKELGL